MHRFTQNFERRTSYHFAMCQFQSHVVNKFKVFSEQNSRMLSHRDMIICGVVHNLFFRFALHVSVDGVNNIFPYSLGVTSRDT